MNCIFCKSDSFNSTSVEHIIPESLGNSKHILPRRIVCDKCNNYFARKVEKPLLDTEYFTHVRFRNVIPNKKGRIPPLENVYGPKGIQLGLSREPDGSTTLYAIGDKNSDRFIKYLQTHRDGYFIIPDPSIVDPYMVARFLAKVALEVLTEKVIAHPGWETAVVFRQELDELRHFARYGDQKKTWPFYERRIYREHHKFTSEAGEDYEVLHEFDTLYTKKSELYIVIVILGVEYTINAGGPEISGYIEWLEENEYRSPLYLDRDII